MPDIKVPQPGPAKLTKGSGPDEWLKAALNNQHLPEAIMKKLCEMCKELLMEGEYHLTGSSLGFELMWAIRIKYPACFYPSDYLWRLAWTIL